MIMINRIMTKNPLLFQSSGFFDICVVDVVDILVVKTTVATVVLILPN